MAEPSPLAAALRRRFRSLDEALVKLGIDPYILDPKENQEMIDLNQLPRDVRNARFTMRTKSGKRVSLALDEGGEEQDKIERWLDYFKQKMHPEDFEQLKQLLAPYMADENAEDEPPPFPGRPRPGGSIDPAAGTDRRGQARDWPPSFTMPQGAFGDPDTSETADARRGRARDLSSEYGGSALGDRRARDRAARALDQRLALDAAALGIPDVATAFNITPSRGLY